MKTRSTTFVQALGLLAVLVGVLGVAVVAYLHANPLPQLSQGVSSHPLVTFIGTAWGIIVNGALATSGIGIFRLKNWGRVLALLYAALSIVEFLIRAAAMTQVELPSSAQFVLLIAPLAIWIGLLVLLTRRSIASKFEGSEESPRVYGPERTSSVENQSVEMVARRSSGWGQFAGRFVGAFVLYAGASHLYFPYTTPGDGYSPLQVIVYYLAGYLILFLVIYLVISIPTVIVAKLAPRYRLVPFVKLLNGAVLPALIVGALVIYGGWYGSSSDRVTSQRIQQR